MAWFAYYIIIISSAENKSDGRRHRRLVQACVDDETRMFANGV